MSDHTENERSKKTAYELYIYHQTDKAILCAEGKDAKDDEKFWLPLSQVSFEDDAKPEIGESSSNNDTRMARCG